MQGRDDPPGWARQHPLPLLVAAPCLSRWWLRWRQAESGTYQDRQWTLQIIKRSDRAKCFEVLPGRWVVERTFAWLNRNRRLAKDFERTIESATAWLYLASIQPNTRRIGSL